MKIGLVQMNPVLGDFDNNLKTIARLLKEAEDADLIVLPELCHCGYNFESKEQAFDSSEPASDRRYIDLLSE